MPKGLTSSALSVAPAGKRSSESPRSYEEYDRPPGDNAGYRDNSGYGSSPPNYGNYGRESRAGNNSGYGDPRGNYDYGDRQDYTR